MQLFACRSQEGHEVAEFSPLLRLWLVAYWFTSATVPGALILSRWQSDLDRGPWQFRLVVRLFVSAHTAATVTDHRDVHWVLLPSRPPIISQMAQSIYVGLPGRFRLGHQRRCRGSAAFQWNRRALFLRLAACGRHGVPDGRQRRCKQPVFVGQ